jgi:hypothetical protein
VLRIRVHASGDVIEKPGISLVLLRCFGLKPASLEFLASDKTSEMPGF